MGRACLPQAPGIHRHCPWLPSAQAALFDQAGVLYSSHLYSQAVEERVIEQEVRRQAKTLPEKVRKAQAQ